MNNGLSVGLSRGAAPVFIVQWDARVLLDQTDLTKSRDDSS